LATGSGYGKVILFGEHFVVDGVPAIASAIADQTDGEARLAKGDPPAVGPETFVINGNGWTLYDNRPETPGYKKDKAAEQTKAIDRMLDFLKIDRVKTPLYLMQGGKLLAVSGVGASAASCTALARSINGLLGLKLDDERINNVAFEGEKGFAGTPSGIDNTASVFGGLIYFRKQQPKNIMDRLRLKKPVEIVEGNTGLTSSTEKVVSDVKARRLAEPAKFKPLYDEMEELVPEARKALESYNLKKVGELMNRNHEILQKLTVSCKELDMLVEIARKEGAIGAKMTGTGRGGYMVALTPGNELQENVARAIENAGFKTMKTRIGI